MVSLWDASAAGSGLTNKAQHHPCPPPVIFNFFRIFNSYWRYRDRQRAICSPSPLNIGNNHSWTRSRPAVRNSGRSGKGRNAIFLSHHRCLPGSPMAGSQPLQAESEVKLRQSESWPVTISAVPCLGKYLPSAQQHLVLHTQPVVWYLRINSHKNDKVNWDINCASSWLAQLSLQGRRCKILCNEHYKVKF